MWLYIFIAYLTGFVSFPLAYVSIMNVIAEDQTTETPQAQPLA